MICLMPGITWKGKYKLDKVDDNLDRIKVLPYDKGQRTPLPMVIRICLMKLIRNFLILMAAMISKQY